MSKPSHGFFSATFEAYLVPQLDGSTSMVDTLPVPAADRFGINPSELTGGFSYVFWDSDVRHNVTSGNIQLPLSSARTVSSQIETAPALQLHAPVAQRQIRIRAVRNGQWPKVPIPLNSRVDVNGCVETLLTSRQIADTPKLDSDNANMLYSVQAEWIYAISRPAGYATMNGGSDTDKFPSMSSPIDRTTKTDNTVSVTEYFDTAGTLY